MMHLITTITEHLTITAFLITTVRGNFKITEHLMTALWGHFTYTTHTRGHLTITGHPIIPTRRRLVAIVSPFCPHLPLRKEVRQHRSLHGIIEVRVIEDNERRLPSELQSDLLNILKTNHHVERSRDKTAIFMIRNFKTYFRASLTKRMSDISTPIYNQVPPPVSGSGHGQPPVSGSSHRQPMSDHACRIGSKRHSFVSANSLQGQFAVIFILGAINNIISYTILICALY